MTPMACLWLSNRAGEGGAGSSVSVDILSRTVPVTRVLHGATNYTTVHKSSENGQKAMFKNYMKHCTIIEKL